MRDVPAPPAPRWKACAMRALADMRSDPRDPRHGTVKGYNYGCRCRACAAAKSEHMRRRRPPLRLKGSAA